MTDNALKIIEALGRHKDDSSIDVLRDLGTNSSREDIREKTVTALIRKNSDKALRILLASKGKGINDLSTKVSLSTVSQLLNLEDKTQLMRVLEDAINNGSSDEIKNSARSLKALITLSE